MGLICGTLQEAAPLLNHIQIGCTMAGNCGFSLLRVFGGATVFESCEEVGNCPDVAPIPDQDVLSLRLGLRRPAIFAIIAMSKQ